MRHVKSNRPLRDQYTKLHLRLFLGVGRRRLEVQLCGMVWAMSTQEMRNVVKILLESIFHSTNHLEKASQLLSTCTLLPTLANLSIHTKRRDSINSCQRNNRAHIIELDFGCKTRRVNPVCLANPSDNRKT